MSKGFMALLPTQLQGMGVYQPTLSEESRLVTEVKIKKRWTNEFHYRILFILFLVSISCLLELHPRPDQWHNR